MLPWIGEVAVLQLYAVSDATGHTAERVLRSALVQFDDAPVEIHRRGGIADAEAVASLVGEVARRGGIIVHTLVRHELRRCLLRECRRRAVDQLDLMGPLLDRLTTHLDLSPQERPGLFEHLTAIRAREIEAVEFAFRHDDGQRTDELERAEVVLVGVSRTMKTPVCLFLAYRGWFAANVPIVPGVPLPAALTDLPAERVLCLGMSATRLRELRRARADLLAVEMEEYTALAAVQRELALAHRLSTRHGWREIRTTGKSVEEVSREIILLLEADPIDHPTDSPYSDG
jgi:regulator of PEP synthase PpsR (kinase-PPPase family)